MQVEEIEIGFTDSFKVDNYQYVKPELRLKIKVKEGENADELINQAQDYILHSLETFVKKKFKKN